MARQGDPFHSSLDSDLDGAVDSLFEHQSSADKERKARLVPLRAVCRALRQAARYIQHRPYASVARLARRGSLWAPLPRAAEETKLLESPDILLEPAGRQGRLRAHSRGCCRRRVQPTLRHSSCRRVVVLCAMTEA